MIRALNVERIRLDLGDVVLSLQDVHWRHAGRTLLAGVDLDVRRGAYLALCGPAGSGKSALLACVAGVGHASAGRVRFCGYEIRRLPQARIVRMGIARVADGLDFTGMTVGDALTAGALLRRRLSAARPFARTIAERCELTADWARRIEELDETARRRARLACAYATAPQLLLVDDATDDLAPLLAAIRTSGTTVVAAMRDATAYAPFVDAVIPIANGTATARIGTPSPPQTLAAKDR